MNRILCLFFGHSHFRYDDWEMGRRYRPYKCIACGARKKSWR